MDFIVLSSSRGTTFQAILDRLADGTLTATCLGLISDRKEHGCIEKARKFNLPVSIVERKKEESPEGYDRRLHKVVCALLDKGQRIKDKCISPIPYPLSPILVLIGWFSILSPWFIQKFENRILNIHPALLPRFGGKGMYGIKVHESVLNAREKESGMTIHIVNEQVDAGPILLQKRCPVLPTDTPETLKRRVQELEKEWYPKVLQMIEEGVIQMN